MQPGTPRPTPTLREALSHFARLLQLVRPFWSRLAAGLLIGTVVGCLGLVTPYLSKLYIDQVYPTGDLALLNVLVVAVAVFTLVAAFLGALRAYYSAVVSSHLSTATTLLFFNHLQHLPTSFFDRHRVGELMSRFGDVRSALAALARVLQTVFGSGIYLFIAPAFLILLNWKLALLSIASLPVTTGVSVLSGRAIRKYWKHGAEQAAELNALQVEVLTHIRTVKTMVAEHRVYRSVHDQTRAAQRAQLTASGIGSAVMVFNGAVRTAGTTLYTWLAWRLILSGEMTLGDFVAFSAYIGLIVGPFNQFAGLFADFQQTAVTLGRTFEYLDEPPEQIPSISYHPLEQVVRSRGNVRLQNVRFSYEAGCPVLDDVSLELRSGTVTAVVGASGAGKSSILRLLCRMSEPDSGIISLDGVPLRDLPLHNVRRQVSVVWQDVALMRGTIWDNLVYGNPEADSAAVEDAVRTCQLSELIGSLQDGYDTPVAEWGASLSGGQRQRLAIARALVRDTPILLLDEATSQVDVETEEAILRELFATVSEKTVLFVTHRVGTAALADQVCVLERGGIAGIGSHSDLVGSCDVYRRLLRYANGGESRSLRVLGA